MKRKFELNEDDIREAIAMYINETQPGMDVNKELIGFTVEEIRHGPQEILSGQKITATVSE